MSACYQLMKGFDLECFGAKFTKYYQQAVLINKKDVDEYKIVSSTDKNRVSFNLKEGKTGFLFRGSENGSSFSASFSKTEKKGVTYYSHNLELPIVGVNEDSKTMLKQIDLTNFFAATHFKDGTIEIHGFKNGLKTEAYTFESGQATIPLISRYEEYDPPYVYYPSRGDKDDWKNLAIQDFNNLFANITPIFQGDFNNDFNDDFYILGS